MRLIKGVGLTLLLVVLVFAGLYESEWLPPTSDVARKAESIMGAPVAEAKGEHDAYPLLWLAEYDVPDADQGKVMAADVAHFAALTGQQAIDAGFQTSADGKYRKEAWSDDAQKALCPEEDCLAKVRERIEPTRKLIADHPLLVAHAQALAHADHLHVPFAAGSFFPQPPGSFLSPLAQTDAAFEFAGGKPDQGLALACAAALSERRHATGSDEFPQRWIGAARYRRAAKLVAEMLAELPATYALPQDCSDAFAPVTDAELNQCDASRREFAAWDVGLDAWFARSDHPALIRLVSNRRATHALAAVWYAGLCSDDPEIAAADAQMKTRDAAAVDGWLGSVFDPFGTELVTNFPFSLELDDARLRMINVRVVSDVMRADVASRASGSPALPAGITLDAQQHTLKVTLPYNRHGMDASNFVVPIAASRVH